MRRKVLVVAHVAAEVALAAWREHIALATIVLTSTTVGAARPASLIAHRSNERNTKHARATRVAKLEARAGLTRAAALLDPLFHRVAVRSEEVCGAVPRQGDEVRREQQRGHQQLPEQRVHTLDAQTQSRK